MKARLSNYSKPRPVYLQVIGDTFLYASTAITASAIAVDNHIMAYISLGLGITGYFFSKLFAAIDSERTYTVENSQKLTQTTTIKEVNTPKEDAVS